MTIFHCPQCPGRMQLIEETPDGRVEQCDVCGLLEVY